MRKVSSTERSALLFVAAATIAFQAGYHWLALGLLVVVAALLVEMWRKPYQYQWSCEVCRKNGASFQASATSEEDLNKLKSVHMAGHE